MKKTWRCILMFNLVTWFLLMGCFCSSQKELSYDQLKGALKYFNKLEGTVNSVMDTANRFHRGISKWDRATIDNKLKELQDTISQNADKAGQMGGYMGDSDFNYAVLDLLEFHESIYAEDFPQLLQFWLNNETTALNMEREKYNQRVKEELPKLQKKYRRAKFAFMKTFSIPKPPSGLSGEMATIERSMDLLQQHGYGQDARRVRRIRDKFNKIEEKRKQSGAQ